MTLSKLLERKRGRGFIFRDSYWMSVLASQSYSRSRYTIQLDPKCRSDDRFHFLDLVDGREQRKRDIPIQNELVWSEELAFLHTFLCLLFLPLFLFFLDIIV